MNKKFLVLILMIATIFSCIGLTGCKKTKTTNSPTKQEQGKKQDKEQKQVDKEEFSKKINEAKKFETKEKTVCYRMLGEKNDKKVYYTMAMPQAREVTKFVTTYLKAGANIDYKTVKGDNQYQYYSKKLQQEYGGKEKCDQDSISEQKELNIVQKFLGCNGYNCIEFNKDFTTCKVVVNRLIMFNNFSKESKLAKSKVQLNTIYSQKATYNLIIENGNWKVNNEDLELVFYPFKPSK